MTRIANPSLFPGLAGDDDGVTIVEFAILAPVLLTILFGIFDVGHTAYVRSVLQGAVQDAGRDAGLETGRTELAGIDTYVESQVRSLVGKDGEFEFERLNYQSFNDVGRPEDFDDDNDNDVYDEDEECFTDANGNDQWDADVGAAGLGGANDVVLYRVTVTYERPFPLWRFIGGSSEISMSANTILRNQPFATQSARPTRQICP